MCGYQDPPRLPSFVITRGTKGHRSRYVYLEAVVSDVPNGIVPVRLLLPYSLRRAGSKALYQVSLLLEITPAANLLLWVL